MSEPTTGFPPIDPYRAPEAPLFSATKADASALETVGFGGRILPRLLDMLLHMGAAFGGGILGGILVAVTGGNLEADGPDDGLASVIGVLGFLAAYTIWEGFGGASPGKAAFGLRVVTTTGDPVGPVAALKRNVAVLWDSLFFGIVAAQRMGKSDLEQRYGDAWAKTIVVRRSSLQKPASAM